jgi:hypothetical protein
MTQKTFNAKAQRGEDPWVSKRMRAAVGGGEAWLVLSEFFTSQLTQMIAKCDGVGVHVVT